MYNVMLIDQNNANVTVEVIRFFKATTASYVIYSLNEKDESGFIKLYASKLEGEKDLVKIESELEWNQVKDYIKVIVKEAKDGLVTVSDLDYKKLNMMNMKSNRVFKLTIAVAEMLGLNKKEFKEEVIAPIIEPVIETPVVEAPIIEKPLVETPVVSVADLFFEEPIVLKPAMPSEVVVRAPQVEEKIVKKISTLEELLGGAPLEMPKASDAPVIETPFVPAFEEPKEDLTKTVADLKAQVAMLEAKLAKIKEII